MARLKDIAERTGLSVNTISLALRGSPRIPAETQDRIRKVADAMDYTPNHAAKVLHSRQTMTVGLLLPDITNPLLTRVANCVEQALGAHGYVTLLATATELADEQRALATFRSRQVDGILLFPCNHVRLDHVLRLRKGGMPVVLLAGDSDGELDAVCMDERNGALRATRHLVHSGHCRIGLIDNSYDLRANPAKMEGYRDALAEAGLTIEPLLHVAPEGDSVRSGYDAFARLMSQPSPPTAVLAGDDRLALGGLRWCLETGLRVPQDVAIFGYDNVEYSAFAATPLSSVDNPSADLAQAAVSRLLELIANRQDMPPPQVRMITPELVLRESTARPGKGNDVDPEHP